MPIAVATKERQTNVIEYAELVLISILRCSLWLSISATIVCFYLRIANAQPRTQSIAWLFVLAQGCLCFCFVVEIPWYSMPDSILSQPLPIGASPAGLTGSVDFFSPVPPAASLIGPSDSSTAYWFPVLSVTLATIWLSGMLWLAVSQVIGYWRLLQQINTTTHRPTGSETEWLNELQAVKTALSLSSKIEMRVAPQLGPLICRTSRGYLLVVPELFWQHSSSRQRSNILRHELTHIKRFDPWTSLVARLLALPQWFNPFTRLALLKLDQSLEMGCDDQSHEHSETDRIDYAQTLVALVEFAQPRNSLVLPAARPPLEQRIRRILHPQGTEMKFSRTIIGATLIIFALISLVRVQLIARQPSPETTTATTTPQPIRAQAKLPESAPDQLLTKVYYIGDLIVPEANFSREYDGKQWIAVSSVPDENSTPSVTSENIIELIQATIESDSWKINGGRGTLVNYQLNLSLIAVQTRTVHKQVADLMTKLREINDIRIRLTGYVVVFPRDTKSLAEYGLKVDRPLCQFSTQDTRAFRAFAFSEKLATLVDFLPYEVINGQTVPFHFKKIGDRELKTFEVAVVSKPNRKSLNLACYSRSNSEQQPMARFFPQQVIDPGRKTIALAHILNNESACFDITETLKDNPDNQRAILIVKASLRDNKSN